MTDSDIGDPFPGIKNWKDGWGIFMGLSAIGVHNVLNSRPVISRLPLFVFGGAVGLGVAKSLTWLKSRYGLTRDVYMLDYVQQHPELFPEHPRQRLADKLEEWTPYR